jgi:ankyrin repeat protein
MVELEALVDAAKAGDETKVRRLMAAHPDLTVKRLPSGESPLMAALYRGHHSVVDALVELGAEVDIFAAAATGRLTQLKRELSKPGAARTYSYDGWTPLHLAAFFGHVEAARMLLQAGADIQSVSCNSLKNTPLHAATAGKHAAVALLLLEGGADAQVADGGGHTANRIASENQLTSVLAAMAKPR